MTKTNLDVGQATAARLAGATYLVTMATAIFSQSFIRGSLVVRGDATQTAQNIIASERLYRIGIAADIVTFTGVVVLTWALYVLLRPVGKHLAVLAVLLRLVEVAVHYVVTMLSLGVLLMLGGGHLATFDASQRYSVVRLVLSAQGAGLNLGFVLLGLGSAVFAYLLLRSHYVPKALAALGMVASLLLSASAIAVILLPAVGPAVRATMVPMFVYEVSLGLWLLLKGAATSSVSSSAA